MVSVCEGMILDINDRVAHIHAQTGLGADVAEVTAEQSRALLRTFSQLKGIEIGDITRVSNHLLTNAVWDRNQLSAFSACLRANITKRLHQPGIRPMQSCPCLEYYFLQTDFYLLMIF